MQPEMRKPQMVSGILLEYTALEFALETLSMDRTDLTKILDATPEWPFPARLDGWKLSHDAIRFDMDNLQTVIDALRSQANDGRALDRWQLDAFRLVMNEFYRAVHKHHDHEEEIFFPWMATRVKLPPKMSSDHATLMALMDKAQHHTWSLVPGDVAGVKPTMEELSTTFSQLRALMRQHLEEEEIIGLPLMRKNFTAKEMRVPEKKIVSQMQPRDLAWFLRPMDLATKKVTMSRLGIPGPVQWLIMLPACRKDERTVVQAYRDLAAGQRAQDGEKAASKPSKGLFARLRA